jgi:hypothetical protein
VDVPRRISNPLSLRNVTSAAVVSKDSRSSPDVVAQGLHVVALFARLSVACVPLTQNSVTPAA